MFEVLIHNLTSHLLYAFKNEEFKYLNQHFIKL